MVILGGWPRLRAPGRSGILFGVNRLPFTEFDLVVVDPSVKIVYLDKMIEITGLPTPVAWEWRELSTSTSTQGKWHSATVLMMLYL